MNSRLTLGGVSLKEYYSSPPLQGHALPEKDILELITLALRYAVGHKLVVSASGRLDLAPTVARQGDVMCPLELQRSGDLTACK